MAIQAAVLHGVRFPWGSVTGLTIFCEVGMRRNPAKCGAGRCIQLAGAVHCPAAGKRGHSQGNGRDQTSDQPGTRQAAKTQVP